MFNNANETHFSLSIEGFQSDLQVLSFKGIEGISQPFRFDLELVSENPDLDLETLLHKQAFLAFDPAALNGGGSGIHGQIYRVAQGDAGKRLTRYKVSLVPQLAYLEHRTNQRIYQQLSAPKIIALILEEHGIQGNAYRFQLGTPCPERDYCVQYD
ncbi:contractile injection system protein, VgrG/Pvc8 family, partial [Pseudomonas chlororaphis]